MGGPQIIWPWKLPTGYEKLFIVITPATAWDSWTADEVDWNSWRVFMIDCCCCISLLFLISLNVRLMEFVLNRRDVASSKSKWKRKSLCKFRIYSPPTDCDCYCVCAKEQRNIWGIIVFGGTSYTPVWIANHLSNHQRIQNSRTLFPPFNKFQLNPHFLDHLGLPLFP